VELLALSRKWLAVQGTMAWGSHKLLIIFNIHYDGLKLLLETVNHRHHFHLASDKLPSVMNGVYLLYVSVKYLFRYEIRYSIPFSVTLANLLSSFHPTIGRAIRRNFITELILIIDLSMYWLSYITSI
jgi:hypothetical protein